MFFLGIPARPAYLEYLAFGPGHLESKIFKIFKMGGWWCVGIQPILPPPPAHLEYAGGGAISDRLVSNIES